MSQNERDSLGERLKRYEKASCADLTWRLPMIIRVDGRSFHSFTKSMQKPWDPWLVGAMQRVAVALCEEISGCKLAYVQSDEISLLVRDDATLQTQPWFGKDLQKIVSVAAGIASAHMALDITAHDHRDHGIPVFDARAFVLPPAEVCNYFVWRQQDAVRNSVQMLGHHHFSPKQMHGLNNDQVQEKLWQEKQVNWNDTPTQLKRGSCVTRVVYEGVPVELGGAVSAATQLASVTRHRWEVDLEIPTFTQDRSYVEKLLTDEATP